MKDKYTVDVQEDKDGELFIEFPADLLNQMGWHEDTLIEWLVGEDGSVLIKEVKDGKED
jgi:antitoxin component of MazEF toxin-antitoxin module